MTRNRHAGRGAHGERLGRGGHGQRVEGSGTPPRSSPRKPPVALGPEVEPATRYGLVMAVIFAAVGLLLLVLSALGRGWLYLLGAVDFLVIAGVLAWVVWRAKGPAPR